MMLAIIIGLASVLCVAFVWLRHRATQTEESEAALQDYVKMTEAGEGSADKLPLIPDTPAHSASEDESKKACPGESASRIERSTQELPRLALPAAAKAKSVFQLNTQCIRAGESIFADKTHFIGHIHPSGTTDVSLSVPGIRTIDVKVGETWVSATILIQESE